MARIEKLIAALLETRQLVRERLGDGHSSCSPFTFLQMATLRFIKDRRGPTMRELADYLQVTPPSATALVDGLVRSGLIRRIADRKDRRAVRLALTAKGGKTLTAGCKAMTARLRLVLSSLSANDQEALLRILHHLAAAYRE